MIKKNYQPRPLDEVIDLLSSIYYNDQKKAIKDAVFYLKEYKDKIYTFAYQYAEMQQYLEEKNNKPLTWDELRQMHWKPVWIQMLVNDSDPNSSRWMLVQSDCSFGNFWLVDGCGARYNFFEKDMNSIWQAYRKEK